MQDDIRKYIEQNISLLDGDHYEELYAGVKDRVNQITDALITAGINPQLYMSEIVDKMYYNLGGLSGVDIAPTIKRIGDNAFYTSDITQINMPASVVSVGECAFANCWQLEKVHFGENVTEIPHAVCMTCGHKLETVSFGDHVTKIGGYAFCDCYKLKDVTFPNTLQQIGAYAFYRCHKFTKLNIPDSVTTIGEGAFQRCTGVTVVNLGKGLKSIGKYAFKGLYKGGVTVNYAGTMDDWKKIQLGPEIFGLPEYYKNVLKIHCTDKDVIL